MAATTTMSRSKAKRRGKLLPDIILELLKNPRPLRNTKDYSPEIGAVVMKIMGEGYSLTAAAGWLGLSREMVYRWMDNNPDFAEIVEIGKAKRTYALERDLKHSPNAAVTQARLFALQNAAPKEWQRKPKPEPEPKESFLARLADALLPPEKDEAKKT